MLDIWTAVAVMSALSLGAGWLFFRLLPATGSGQWAVVGLAFAVVAMIYFLLYGSGQLFWARFVPVSAAIIYTNLAAIFAAIAAGCAGRLPQTPAWRRGLLSGLLTMAALAAIHWPLLSVAVRPPPQGGDQWQGDVAQQTSWATCSPAAAATLFRGEGIAVSERELIPLCLTDSSGTPTLGLYRGIKLVAERHRRRVDIVQPSLPQLLADDDWPVLLAVELPFGVEDRRYADAWGWIPGLGHSVVALGRTVDGRIAIGDPSAGLEFWRAEDLQVLWQGNGIRLR
ncbi:MAG: hypothetical protein KDA45_12985 [Planctomycetales bacterium]|nr:hypothetical protein [Planctomycetales bacterium]